jgi:hypothetical protein
MNCIVELNPGQKMTLPIVVNNGSKTHTKISNMETKISIKTPCSKAHRYKAHKHINKQNMQQPKHVTSNARKNKPR